MTAEQFAQRLGCELARLDFNFDEPCQSCRKTGAVADSPCHEGICKPKIVITRMKAENETEKPNQKT
jgi:hypothetical protein